MIKFEGEIDGICLEDYYKRMKKEKIMIVIFSLVMGVAILAYISYLTGLFEELFLSLIGFVPLIVYAFLPLTKGEKRKFKAKNLPHVVIIDPEKEAIIVKNKAPTKEFPFSTINEIHDFGEYYVVITGDPATRCQKSLLVEGTIEEFEKLFEGKIIKKY